jgi:hypothetical protein
MKPLSEWTDRQLREKIMEISQNNPDPEEELKPFEKERERRFLNKNNDKT